MNELGSAGVVAGLQRRYEIRDEAPVHSIATELFPVVQASDAQMDAELAFRAGLRLAGAWIEDAAVAAMFSSVGLRNPAGSGMLGIITAIYCFAQTPTPTRYQFRIDIGSTIAEDSAGPGFTRDTRWGNAATSLQRLLLTAAAPMSSQVIVPAGIDPAPIVHIPVTPFVLAPGDTVWVQALDANVAARVGFLWRERRASGGELS